MLAESTAGLDNKVQPRYIQLRPRAIQVRFTIEDYMQLHWLAGLRGQSKQEILESWILPALRLELAEEQGKLQQPLVKKKKTK